MEPPVPWRARAPPGEANVPAVCPLRRRSEGGTRRHWIGWQSGVFGCTEASCRSLAGGGRKVHAAEVKAMGGGIGWQPGGKVADQLFLAVLSEDRAIEHQRPPQGFVAKDLPHARITRKVTANGSPNRSELSSARAKTEGVPEARPPVDSVGVRVPPAVAWFDTLSR